MKNSKILLVAAIAILGAACTPKAQINGTISGLTTGDTLTVNVLDVNVLKEKTKVAVEADGSFKVTIPASDVDPDIIYLSCKGYILPSLIVFPKDNITVVADTLGAFSVSGSQEFERLAEYQKEFSRTNAKLDAIEAKINAAEDIKEYTREFSKELLDHYRYALKYVITNNKSLTSIQVLNQSIGPYSDVLMRHTDAFTFKTACDTLETVYPKSRYVKALRKEADRRIELFNIYRKLSEANEMGYPDITLPDTKAEKIALKDIAENNKIVLVHFWRSTEAANNIFNTSVLKDIYATYHGKGLEIYAVSMDTDKGVWARAVKDQDLPWINVCDGLGVYSPVVGSFNVATLPLTYIIGDGEIIDKQITYEDDLRNYLKENLK